MNKTREWLKDKYIYILAFLIPWIIVAIHSFLRNGWPFGTGSILNGDSATQYYQLCVELWNKVHSGQSLFYSWNAGEGFDFYLNMTYYLISPFTILILAVPKSWLMDVVQAVMILKWSGIYVSMLYYYMHTDYNKNEGIQKKWISFVLTSIYALSNCILVRITYFNWNDVLILFPFILLELEKLVKTAKWKRYFFLLWLAMLCNFYTAYQVCIFLLLWFIFSLNKDIKHKKRVVFVFLTSSLLSALSALIVILPSLLGVFGRYSSHFNSGADKAKGYAGKVLVNYWDFVSKTFLMDDISDMISLKPNMYFSIGGIVFLLLCFFIKSEYKKKYITLMLLMLIGIFVGVISFVWHGFSVPHGAYHRFLYLVIFLFTFIILDVVNNLQNITWKAVALTSTVWFASMVMAFVHISEYQEFYVYLSTILMYAFYQIMIILYARRSIGKKTVLIICGVLVMAELLVNAVFEFQIYDQYSIMNINYTKEAEKLSETIELDDGERFQVVQGISNDGLLFGLPSNDIFMSYCNGDNVVLHRGFGMEYRDEAACSLYGASPLLNLIFNMRYGIGDNEIYFSDVEEKASEGKMKLYETKRLAGLGYMVDNSITEWEGAYSGPFISQNRFSECAVGIGGIFDIIKPEVESYAIVPVHADQDVVDSGFYVYNYDSLMVEGQEYTLVRFVADEDMDLYVMANNGIQAISTIYVNSDMVMRDATYHIQETFHIGNVSKGDVIKIYATHEMDIGTHNTMWYQFAKYNEDVYQEAYARLSKNVYQINEMKASYVSGDIHSDEDGIMMTSIQAMKGFTVYVDGEKTDYKVIGDTYIGVPLSSGDHKVEFKYVTPYFIEGALGSLVGIMIFVIICIYDNKIQKSNSRR